MDTSECDRYLFIELENGTKLLTASSYFEVLGL